MSFNYRGGSNHNRNEKFTWKPDKKFHDTNKSTISDFGVESAAPWNDSFQQPQHDAQMQDAWNTSSEEYASNQQKQIHWTGQTNEELNRRTQNNKQYRDGSQNSWRGRKRQEDDRNERRTFIAGQNYQTVSSSTQMVRTQQPNIYHEETDSMNCFCPVRTFQIAKIQSFNEKIADTSPDIPEQIPDGLILSNDWQITNFPIFNEMQPNGLYSLFSYALLFAKLQIKELYDMIITERSNSEEKTLKPKEMQIDIEANSEIKNDNEKESDNNIQIEQNNSLPSNPNQQSGSYSSSPIQYPNVQSNSSSSSQAQSISQQVQSPNEQSFTSSSQSTFNLTPSIITPQFNDIFGTNANPPTLPIYLPPMSKSFRKTLHKCAEIFGLIAHSHGKQEGIRHIVINFPQVHDNNGNIIQINQDGKRIFGIQTLKLPTLHDVLRSIQDFDESGFQLYELFESTATFPRYFTDEQKQRHIFARRLHCLQHPQDQLPRNILQSIQWADQLIAGLENNRPKHKDIHFSSHEQFQQGNNITHSNQSQVILPQQKDNYLLPSFQLPNSFSDRSHPIQTQSDQNISSTSNYSTIMKLFEIYFECLPVEVRVSIRLFSALEQCLRLGRKILQVNGPQIFAGRQWQSVGQQDIEAQINTMSLQTNSNNRDIKNDIIFDSNAGLGFVNNQSNLEGKEEQIMEKDLPDSANNDDKNIDNAEIGDNEMWKNSFGFNLMKKFGWNGQDGIGLHQGIKQPIDVTIRKGKEGIGHNKYE